MYTKTAPPVWTQTTYEVRSPSGKYGPTAFYDPTRYVPRAHVRSVSYDPQQLPPYMYPQPQFTRPVAPPKLRPVQTTFDDDRVEERYRAKAAQFADNLHPTSRKSKKSSKHYHEDDPRVYEELSPKGTPPPPYHRWTEEYEDIRIEREYYEPEPPAYKTRPRATSSPQKPASKPSRQDTKSKRRSQTAQVSLPKAPRKATEEDRIRAGIKPGYSLKNWDPAEEPILLLGSVFDANSLGKWIYDWTVYHHGAGSPMADEAGELWLSLINLAQKRKRAEETYTRIRRKKGRYLVKAFIEDADDLWDDFEAILQACEDHMWAKAEKDSSGKKNGSFGSRSGCEFVETIFGRDRELERTINLMHEIRKWTYDFDSQCQAILDHPRD